MRKISVAMTLSVLFLLAACVTINVYFPAAAAERAAQEFVGDVLGEDNPESYLFEPNHHEALQQETLLLAAAGQVLDWLIPSAQAQEPDLDINTPQINAIKARMVKRQRDGLAPLFDAGAIGFSADGLVTIRDRSAVPLNQRRSLESTVADENRDRKAVYREIAVANGHPEWESDVQETFAREWVNNARKGWYYQDSNNKWVTK
jgi:uncharacterized protein YdbL (DUF1318 family)